MPFLLPNQQCQSTEGCSVVPTTSGTDGVEGDAIRTLSGSVMTMLSPGTSDPFSMFSLTTAVDVDRLICGGLLLGSWTIAVNVVELSTSVC